MDNNTQQHAELISALADGQLQGDDFAQALALLDDSAQARATWHAYHVVGDVLRAGGSVVGRDDAGFVARLQARLAEEPKGVQMLAADTLEFVPASLPVVENAINSIAENLYSLRANGQNSQQRDSANHASFRWKMVAGCASLAAVVAIGWNLLGATGPAIGGGQLAQTLPSGLSAQQATAVASTSGTGAQVMLRDPHLDALMAAHKQIGGTSALQMPAGFLRNATFEGPSR